MNNSHRLSRSGDLGLKNLVKAKAPGGTSSTSLPKIGGSGPGGTSSSGVSSRPSFSSGLVPLSGSQQMGTVGQS